MDAFDIQKVYIKLPNGFTEYTGGANFLNGIRACTDCKANMIREPVNQSFIRVPGGKILVNVSAINGRMILHRLDSDYHWVCTECKNVIEQGEKKMVVAEVLPQ